MCFMNHFKILYTQMIHKVHQPPYYQVVCFVRKLSKQDFIAADAIAKLRQVTQESEGNCLFVKIYVMCHRKILTQLDTQKKIMAKKMAPLNIRLL